MALHFKKLFQSTMPQNTLYLVGWKFRERNKCIPIVLRLFLSVMQYKVILIVLLHMLHLSSSLDLMIFNQLVFVVVIIEPVKFEELYLAVTLFVSEQQFLILY